MKRKDLFVMFLLWFLCINANAQAAATNSVSLAWTPVAFPGVSYQVGYGTNTGSTGPYQWTNAPSTNTAATITNLASGLTYYFAVQTIEQPYAPSAWSSEVTATISRLPAPAGVRVTTIIITP